jgi:hypothetical protein
LILTFKIFPVGFLALLTALAGALAGFAALFTALLVLGAGLFELFDTLAAGFPALFTDLAGTGFFVFAADLAGLALAIKLRGGDGLRRVSGKIEARYIMAFPKGRKGKRHLFFSIRRTLRSPYFYELAEE